MMQQPSFITQLNPNDVIVGRGAPANFNEGNKRFRQLAEGRKMDYVATAKREVKDQIARDILETVLYRQGRFVRKIESLIEAEEMGVPSGVTAWKLVDYETALQKTKQVLRDRNKQHGQEASASPSELAGTENPTIGSQSLAQGVPLSLLQQLILNQQQQQLLEQQQRQQLQQQQRAASISDYIRSNLSGASDALADSRPSAEQILSSLNALQGESLATSAAALLPQTQLSSTVGLGAANRTPSTLPISVSGGRLLNDPLTAALARSSALPTPTTTTAAQAGLAPNPAAIPLLSQLGPSPSDLGNSAERSDKLQAKPPARAQESIPIPPSQSKKGETAGDIALRAAFERANGLLPKTSEEELELSLLEMHILAVLCSHGFPAWRPSKLVESFGPTVDPESFSWKSFALLLQQVARDWFEQNELGSSSLSSEKKAFISSTYKSAIKAAKDYEQDPKELAKKTIMLLERLVVFAPNKPSRKRDASSQGIDSKQVRLDSWLEEELCHWAAFLELTIDGGRPFAYSAQDFMKVYPHHRQSGPVTPMGCFDSSLCRVLLSQIACVTRLRCIREKSGSTLVMKTKVDNATAGAPETNDLLLVERLVSFGFLGLFDDQAGSGPSQVPSISHLGLSKASVQERVSQLVQNLHEQQIAEDRQAILQEARKRMVPTELGSPEGSKHPKPDDSLI